MELSMPLPKSTSERINQHCSNEDCTPRAFQLGDVIEGFGQSVTIPVRHLEHAP